MYPLYAFNFVCNFGFWSTVDFVFDNIVSSFSVVCIGLKSYLFFISAKLST